MLFVFLVQSVQETPMENIVSTGVIVLVVLNVILLMAGAFAVLVSLGIDVPVVRLLLVIIIHFIA